MNYVKLTLSTLAYAFVNTVIAVIYHDQVFGSYYYGFNIYSAGENFSIPIATFGTLIEGLVLSYIVQKWAPSSDRMKFSITMGILLCLFASSYDVFQTAALEMVQGAGRWAFIPLEFTAMMIYGLVGGSLVGWINRE